MPKNKSDDLAFDEIKVSGYGETKVTLFCQVQELYVEFWGGNTVDNAFANVSEVEGEVFRDEEGLVVG